MIGRKCCEVKEYPGTNTRRVWIINRSIYRKNNHSVEYIAGPNKGRKEWTNSKGFWHREDGPAILNTDGSKLFYIDGERLGENVYWAYMEKYKEENK